MPEKTLAEITIYVEVVGYTDMEEINQVTYSLISELRELDLDSAETIQNQSVPKGTMSGSPIDMGAILVKIAEVGGITSLISTLSSWLSRDERRTIKLQVGENKIELTGISKVDQKKLIEWFQTQAGIRLLEK